MNPSSMQEDFEFLAKRFNVPLGKTFGGKFLNSGVQAAWEDWQARAALSTQPQQAGWMPIETAPKTGRTLLLGYFNSAGNWRTMRGQWMSQDYIDEYCEEPDDVEPGWFETVVESDDMPNCWRTDPTHWMPLPPVPGQEGGIGE